MIYQTILSLHKNKTLTGVLLILATVLAMYLNNSGWADSYHIVLHTSLAPGLKAWDLPHNIHGIINEGLMIVFFFYIGLEVKHEMVAGELNSFKKTIVPAMAAIGGIIVPAIIYLIENHSDPFLSTGWAIPTATDIAFAVGLLSSVSRLVAHELKILLVTIAIFDDICAIAIIALFYSTNVYLPAFGITLLAILAMAWLCKKRVIKLRYYILPAIITWYSVLRSGVHTTLSGFIIGMSLPTLRPDEDPAQCNNAQANLIKRLQPWVEYGILPIFAFANAGVHIVDFSLQDFSNTLVSGVFYGLLIGKPLGICLALLLTLSLGIEFSKRLHAMEYLGMSFFCGIGFTMSLFIGDLAFASYGQNYMQMVRLGVMLASLCAAIIGYIILSIYYRNHKENQHG